jgi:hypothetical protein
MLGVRGGSNLQSLLVRRVLGLDRGMPWAAKAIEPMVSADSGWTNVANELERLHYSWFHEREQGACGATADREPATTTVFKRESWNDRCGSGRPDSGPEQRWRLVDG